MLTPLTTTLTTLSLIVLIASATPPTTPAKLFHTTNATTAHLGLSGFKNESAIFAPLLPPLYRHARAGGAWIFNDRGSGNGSTSKELGARELGCECFDPRETCCLPPPPSQSPFCIPPNSTCCGNTFCIEGEVCCGGFCCAANTSCTLPPSPPGCCPLTHLCASPATCYSHFSQNCTSSIQGFVRKEGCCPVSLPWCWGGGEGGVGGVGVGCYASLNTTTTSSSTTTTTTTSTTTSSSNTAPTITPAATTNILTSLLSAALLPSTTPMTATATVTVTVSVAGDRGLVFPALGTGGGGVETRYEFSGSGEGVVVPSVSGLGDKGAVGFRSGGVKGVGVGFGVGLVVWVWVLVLGGM